jgi:hypothetical protein
MFTKTTILGQNSAVTAIVGDDPQSFLDHGEEVSVRVIDYMVTLTRRGSDGTEKWQRHFDLTTGGERR